MGETTTYHIRLVVFGGGGVGKSAILKRFLLNTFNEKHSPTVEDLHYCEFAIGTLTLKVDFLDTAGDNQFPAMRRLSIATAQAFLLVYSVDSSGSFEDLKKCFDEIREQRSDFQDIPIIVVGNKLDLAAGRREILKEDVAEWVFCEMPQLCVKVMECSARDNINVREVFKAFLQLSKISIPADTTGLHRRSSAHASGASKSRSSEETTAQRRSRSLIRRVSKKMKKNRDIPHSDTETNECVTS
ncbi:GTP-binding protein Di-Ras2-like [Limulus polyphemus]|uniref:GTP-binding protein Di-Ras2-like n=1 Tax=Limulus polyphemus TaxID=6850 RepID=A0ABM1S9E9_LIMPO|nr:GTP-binding protein Di-Ras2-like [Limulus polyphemus]XP_022240250.1 GTP-binding protein Di-Ras2-like [Limulus polyphemus]XP_022240251.1 GTP-binding protein Di-Ras2-like [Limulus polyphemus]XP_022240252.1 GTP-binding protein Di-Ras2-like [Limulus polyphemus]XP_022240253.1 GTP-binding protein Di-Ras2-like [Limulus polyphemus]XP_022240254.1 GTP-binding protein Di-Ras2-like [Limulus polyphemus]